MTANMPKGQPSETICVQGILASDPVFGALPGGGAFASFTMLTSEPVGKLETSGNTVWPVIVHRLPAVEQLKAAEPGDMVELRGIVQDARFLVPRTEGRIDILLCD